MNFGHLSRSNAPLNAKLSADRSQTQRALATIEELRTELKEAQDENARLRARTVSKLTPDATKYEEVGKAIRFETAARHRMSPTEMCSNSKQRGAVLARQEAMYLMAANTGLSTTQIGRLLGDRDHTTVIYGIMTHASTNNLPLPRGMKYHPRFLKGGA